MNKRSTIAFKALPLMLRTAVLIIIFTTLGMLAVSYYDREKDYKEKGLSYAHMAADYIDGDKIRKYLETGEKDEYYKNVLDFVNLIERDSDLKYYSILVPYEDYGIYIWDGDYDDKYVDLGYREEYVKYGKEYIQKVFRKDPADEILVRKNETENGNEFLAIVCYPIFDSSGEPVALAEAVMDMNGLLSYVFRYVMTLVICVVVILVLSMLTLYKSFQCDIINPILKVNSAAREMVNNLDNNEEDISTENNKKINKEKNNNDINKNKKATIITKDTMKKIKENTKKINERNENEKKVDIKFNANDLQKMIDEEVIKEDINEFNQFLIENDENKKEFLENENKEQIEEIKKNNPEFMPGWGTWAGDDAQIKAKEFLRKKRYEEKIKRLKEQANEGNTNRYVVISNQVDHAFDNQYLVQDLPQEIKNSQQYENLFNFFISFSYFCC